MVEKCWRIVWWRSVGEQSCGQVLENRGVEKCCKEVWRREVMEKGVLEKCWGRVLWRSVGDGSVPEKPCRIAL